MRRSMILFATFSLTVLFLSLTGGLAGAQESASPSPSQQEEGASPPPASPPPPADGGSAASPAPSTASPAPSTASPEASPRITPFNAPDEEGTATLGIDIDCSDPNSPLVNWTVSGTPGLAYVLAPVPAGGGSAWVNSTIPDSGTQSGTRGGLSEYPAGAYELTLYRSEGGQESVLDTAPFMVPACEEEGAANDEQGAEGQAAQHDGAAEQGVKNQGQQKQAREGEQGQEGGAGANNDVSQAGEQADQQHGAGGGGGGFFAGLSLWLNDFFSNLFGSSDQQASGDAPEQQQEQPPPQRGAEDQGGDGANVEDAQAGKEGDGAPTLEISVDCVAEVPADAPQGSRRIVYEVSNPSGHPWYLQFQEGPTDDFGSGTATSWSTSNYEVGSNTLDLYYDADGDGSSERADSASYDTAICEGGEGGGAQGEEQEAAGGSEASNTIGTATLSLELDCSQPTAPIFNYTISGTPALDYGLTIWMPGGTTAYKGVFGAIPDSGSVSNSLPLNPIGSNDLRGTYEVTLMGYEDWTIQQGVIGAEALLDTASFTLPCEGAEQAAQGEGDQGGDAGEEAQLDSSLDKDTGGAVPTLNARLNCDGPSFEYQVSNPSEYYWYLELNDANGRRSGVGSWRLELSGSLGGSLSSGTVSFHYDADRNLTPRDNSFAVDPASFEVLVDTLDYDVATCP